MKFDFVEAALNLTNLDTNDAIPKIESVEQARAARLRLVTALREYGTEGQNLAKRIGACGIRRCRSAACPVCLRHFRIWWSSEIITYMDQDFGPWFTVNIVPSDQSFPIGELKRFHWNKLKDRLRKQIDRSRIWSAKVIGGFDYALQEFDGGRHPKWRPHVYFLTPSGGKLEIEAALREHYLPDDDTPNPVRVTAQRTSQKDLHATATYTFKSYFYARRPRTDQRGNADTDHRGLKPLQQAELALLLDRQGFLGRMIRRGSDTSLPLLTTR